MAITLRQIMQLRCDIRVCAGLFLAFFVLVGCGRKDDFSLRLEKDCLVLSGEFWKSEFEAFEKTFQKHSDIRCVRFGDSPGGATLAGLLIGRQLAERGVRTEAVGDCVSACALAFLGGESRAIRPGARLVFHGSYDRHSGARDPVLSQAIAAWLAERSGGRMAPALIERVVEADSPGAGLSVTADRVDFCRATASDGKPSRACEAMPGLSAADLGLIRD